MKPIQILQLIIVLFFLASCSSDDADNNNEVPEEKILESITISSSKQSLIANTIDKAFINYTFKDQNGITFSSVASDSIKGLIELNINGTISGDINEVTSQSTSMDFILSASIDNINSNTLTIPSYDVQIELTVNENYLYANGKASIIFEKAFQSVENITIEENQLTLEYGSNILNGYNFSTNTAGEYNFKLKSGSIESNEITISALQVEDLFEEIQIALVFHVVPLEGREIGEIGNPTDERIQEAVDMLNSQFSSTAYTEIIDPTIINDITDNELASGNISFYLPDEPQFDSPGIIRYANNVPTTNNFAELTTFVEENILDTYEYINIILYPLQGYGSGFSYYPATTTDTQIPGLSIADESWKPIEYVFLWPNIHPNGTLSFNTGALLSHEVGHYLGLYHVFKGDLFNLPINSCNEFDADYVIDTYEYDRRNHTENPVANESMTMRMMCDGVLEESNNVMDYYFANWYPSVTSTDYSYEIMFTHQQMERIYNVLRTSPVRKQLSGLSQNRVTGKFSKNSSKNKNDVIY